jgi:hypothetical protein
VPLSWPGRRRRRDHELYERWQCRLTWRFWACLRCYGQTHHELPAGAPSVNSTNITTDACPRGVIAVDCSAASFEYRLVPWAGAPAHTGRLELRSNAVNPWSSVAADATFDLKAARAACASLGFGTVAAASWATVQAATGNASAALPPLLGRQVKSVVCPATTTVDRSSFAGRCSFEFDGLDLNDTAGAVALDCRPALNRTWQTRSDAGTVASLPRLIEVRPEPIAAWGTVCGAGIDDADARALCRSLGTPAPTDAPVGVYTAPAANHRAGRSGPVWATQVNCPPEATTLDNCTLIFAPGPDAGTTCDSHAGDVMLDCMAAAWEYRAVRGATGSSNTSSSAATAAPGGRVEVRPPSSNAWGTVCGTAGFDGNAAAAACRSMGHPTAYATVRPVALFDLTAASDDVPVHVQGISCSDNSLRALSYCYRYTSAGCSHHDDIAVLCPQPPSVANASWEVRIEPQRAFDDRGLFLVRPSSLLPFGFVRLNRTGTLNEARLACRMAGRSTTHVGQFSIANTSETSPLWLSGMKCPASATNLSECAFTYIVNTPQTPVREAMGIACGGELWETRVVDAYGRQASRGRVEVREGPTAKWGTVCAAAADVATVTVACANAGFRGDVAATSRLVDDDASLQPFGNAASEQKLAAVQCTSADTLLAFCEPTDAACGATQDLMVECATAADAMPAAGGGRGFEFRLAPLTVGSGAALLESRVQHSGGLWRPVCLNALDANWAAAAACNAVGLGTPAVAAVRNVSSPAWAANLTCASSSPSSCNVNVVATATNGCSTTAFRCLGKSAEFKLDAPSPDGLSGTLLYRPNSTAPWGGVCLSQALSPREANALCRTLVRGAVVGSFSTRNSSAAPINSTTMWLSRLSCPNYATSVAAHCITTVADDGDACPQQYHTQLTCANIVNLQLVRTTLNGTLGAERYTLSATSAIGMNFSVCADATGNNLATQLCRAANSSMPSDATGVLVPADAAPFSRQEDLLVADWRCADGNCTPSMRDKACARAVAYVDCGMRWAFSLINGRFGTQGRLMVRASGPSGNRSMLGGFDPRNFNDAAAWAACRSMRKASLDVTYRSTRGSSAKLITGLSCGSGQTMQECEFTYNASAQITTYSVYLDCGAFPAWLIAVICTIGAVALFIIFGALMRWAVHHRWLAEERLRRLAALMNGPDNDALFDDDVPQALRPIGALHENLATEGDVAVAPQQDETLFAADPLPPLPAPSENEVVRRWLLERLGAPPGLLASIAASNSDLAGRTPMTAAFLTTIVRGKDPIFVTHDTVAFECWDLSGGRLYPFQITLTFVPLDIVAWWPRGRTTAAPRAPHSAAIYCCGQFDAPTAQHISDSLDLPEVAASELFFSIGDLVPNSSRLNSVFYDGQRATAGQRRRLLSDVAFGTISLRDRGFIPCISLDSIAVDGGALDRRAIITTVMPCGVVSDLELASRLVELSATLVNAPVDAASPLLRTPRGTTATVHSPPALSRVLNAMTAGSPTVLGHGRSWGAVGGGDGDDTFPIQVSFTCIMCTVRVTSAGDQVHGLLCTNHEPHFYCLDCVNHRVAALLSDTTVAMADLPCPMGGAECMWIFEDFGSLVRPTMLRRWQKLSVEAVRTRVYQQAQPILEEREERATKNEERRQVREHVLAIRRLLRPKCPLCGETFESFTGCVAVICGARDAEGKVVAGCGKQFCATCMVPFPCSKGCAHAFIGQADLHRQWVGWRKAATAQYLREKFPAAVAETNEAPGAVEGDGLGPATSESSLLAKVLETAKSDLELVGAWPLPALAADVTEQAPAENMEGSRRDNGAA